MHFDNFLMNYASEANNLFDVIAFCETRMSEDLTSVYRAPGYAFFHQPRNRLGGGVALLLNEQLSPKHLSQFSYTHESLECISASINTMDGECIVISLYHPPGSKIGPFFDDLEELISSIDKNKYKQVYIMGDFNIDLFESNSSQRNLINIMLSYSLFCIPNKATRVKPDSATLIDHIWTTNARNCIGNYILVDYCTDHFPVLSYFNVKKQPIVTRTYTKRIFTNETKNEFLQRIRVTSWNNVYEQNTVGEAYQCFKISSRRCMIVVFRVK